jgi:signal transduction histidine kinase
MDEASLPHALEALSDAVLAVSSEQAVGPILQKLVDAARELVGARFAALGIPDDHGAFAEFLTSGISDAEVAAIGPLPRTHGMLDAVMQSTQSMRTTDLRTDTRFGGWPANHPDMRSLLGVPIVSKGSVIGALYLTNKKDAREFTGADQTLIERFAAHAAVIVSSARLFEESRELHVARERNRLARDLHDSVKQTLFSLNLTAEAAADLVDRDPARAKEQIRKVAELARSAQREMTGLVFQLRPASLESEGLVTTLRKHVEVARRALGVDITLDVAGERSLPLDVEAGIFRIVQEALNNAIKHAQAGSIDVSLAMDNGVVSVTVHDDGVGFDPRALPVRTKHLGLTSMEERAQGLDGNLDISSRPGEGTTVALEVKVK